MRFEQPPPEPLASALGFLLSWNGQRIAELFTRALEPLELRPPQFGLMNLIEANPGATQQELVRQSLIDPSSMVATLDDLERARPGRAPPEPRRPPQARRPPLAAPARRSSPRRARSRSASPTRRSRRSTPASARRCGGCSARPPVSTDSEPKCLTRLGWRAMHVDPTPEQGEAFAASADDSTAGVHAQPAALQRRRCLRPLRGGGGPAPRAGRGRDGLGRRVRRGPDRSPASGSGTSRRSFATRRGRRSSRWSPTRPTSRSRRTAPPASPTRG